MWISEFSGLFILIFIGVIKTVLTGQSKESGCRERVAEAAGCNVVTNFNQQNSLRYDLWKIIRVPSWVTFSLVTRERCDHRVNCAKKN